MKILAFDGTAKAATVAVTDGERMLGCYTIDNGLTQSELLLPMAENLLSCLKLSFSDIELFATSVGPGSFTGVRIGVSLVKGLAFGNFTLGEVIPVENPEALDVVLNISQLMEKYELLDLVVEIDVSNPKNIYAYVNQVQIILGDMENGDTKIRYMAEVMKTIPEEDRGTLDLSELDKPNGTVVFRYLT